jgi:hypothetical protein
MKALIGEGLFDGLLNDLQGCHESTWNSPEKDLDSPLLVAIPVS